MYEPVFADTQEIVFASNKWVSVAVQSSLSCWNNWN